MLSKLFFSLLIVCSSLGFTEDTPQEKLKAVQKKIQAKLNKIDQQSKQKDKLLQKLKHTEEEQAALTKKINRTNRSIKENNAQIKLLQQQRGQLLSQELELEAKINDLLFSTYRLSRENQLKLLLNQENPQTLNRSRVFAQIFQTQYKDTIKAYQALRTQLKSNEQAIQAKQADLKKNKASLSASKQQLANANTNRQEVIKQLNQDIKTDEALVDRLRTDQKRLTTLIEEMEKNISELTLPKGAQAFSSRKKKLQKPTTGKLINRFGKRIDKTQLHWQGVIFSTKMGTPVKAPHYGRVIFSGWFKGKGLLLILDHGEGYMTIYAHNETLRVETGDWVEAGSIIATVGNSGGIDDPQLYFEIRRQGEALKPTDWLK